MAMEMSIETLYEEEFFGFTHVETTNKSKAKKISTILCDTCGKHFSCNTNLNKHIRIIHEKQYLKCHICDQEFKRKDQLEHHVNFHLNSKPYKCDLCPKQFASKCGLKKHKKREVSGKTKYQTSNDFKCTEPGCDKSYSLKDSLKKHLETHMPHNCFYCKKSFKRMSRKVEHEKKCYLKCI